MEHIYPDTETGRLIMIALQSLQMEAGISAHPLTDPTPLLVYTESCWISATRDFMAQHYYRSNLQIAGISVLQGTTMFS